jgi:protein-disulfide isomerase
MSLSRFSAVLLTMLALAACSDEAAQSETPPASAAPQASVPTPAPQQQQAAQPASVVTPPAGYPDRFLGEPDAPVTVVEYASLTCIHCAYFHSQALPTLKEKYINSGKVRWIFRDFPLDRLSLAGAQVARCLPEDTYFKFVGLLFESRDRWLREDGDLGPLKQMAMLAGLSGEQADACLTDTKLRDAIVAERLRAATTFKVQATPTVFIADKAYTGDMAAQAMATALERAIAASDAK